MSYWKYMIVGKEIPFSDEISYGIREVYFDNDKPRDFTAENIAPYGETPEELIEDLEMMLKDSKKNKVYMEQELLKEIKNEI